MRPRLGVNVDHLATLRQVRRASGPDPVEGALAAERAGADQIVAHLREDRRHIQDRDAEVLRRVVKTELNLEITPSQEMVSLALQYAPDTATLVPERRESYTPPGGLDLGGQKDQLQRAIRLLQDGGIRVSVFIDADLDQVRMAHKLDAHAVEIHTGRYAESRSFKERSEELARIRDVAKTATKLGLGVGAGHGLNYHNVRPLARITEIQEVNIGHAIVARATIDGFEKAVRDMVALLDRARSH